MSSAEAAFARERARELRHLATRLRDTPAMTLHRYAGVDTWHGPRAASCLTDLTRAQQLVGHSADELDRYAIGLDRHADDLERVASLGVM